MENDISYLLYRTVALETVNTGRSCWLN